MGSYSYTTVSVQPDGKARVSVALHPDESMVVLCSQGGARAQIAVLHCDASVTVCPTDPQAPTGADVRAARELAERFAAYADEVERLHQINQADPGPSEGSAESAA